MNKAVARFFQPMRGSYGSNKGEMRFTVKVAVQSNNEQSEDLSAQIVRLIDRERDDQVTCRRIYGDNYRCNLWQRQDTSGYDNPGMLGLLVTTFRVRKSRFLRVTKSAAGLQFDPEQPPT